MRVTMDGQTISEDAAGVAQALELARAKAAELGRLVIGVQADGEPASELLDRMPDDPAGVTELGVTTAEKSLFLRETLLEARDALDRTRQDQQRAAELVDSGEVAQAIGSLRSIVEGWQIVRSVIDQAATLAGVPVTGLRAGETPGDEAVRALAADLVSLRDAVAKEDWSALSDTLACDLDERAGQWTAMIADLTDRAAGTGPEAGTA